MTRLQTPFGQFVVMLAAVLVGSAALAAFALLWLVYVASEPWSPALLWSGVLAWLGSMAYAVRRLE